MILMSGTELRKKKLIELKSKVENLNEQLSLAVLNVGNDSASEVYIKQKEKLAIELGYKFLHTTFSENIEERVILEKIDELNENDDIDGIIVQMPVPKHLNPTTIQNRVDPLKDVDGLNSINKGKLLHNEECLVSCTPKGIIDLLHEYKIETSGKLAVVIGRSALVGKPISALLSNLDATVIMCHSKTKNLKELTRLADILVVAAGKQGIITKDMIKPGVVVIDVGIHRTENGLKGDVDFDCVKDLASYITPVPGGVGPMTVYELMENVYTAHTLRKRK